MAIPKLPPPPTDPAALAQWANQLYEWLGKSSIDGLRSVNGRVTMRAKSAPSAPVLAQELMGITAGLQFAFNFIDSSAEVVDGYWIYKSSTSNDVTTARRYKYVPQSADGGVYTFQDVIGNGVIGFYWVSAINSSGESDKTPTGSSTSLTSTENKNVLRPTAGTGYANPEAAYDDNLNVAASVTFDAEDSATGTWSGFPAATGTPTALTLKVSMGISGSLGFDLTEALEHSLDGGATWQPPTPAVGGQATYSIALPPTQDLTQLQVKTSAYMADPGGRSGTATHSVYEIWVEVTS